MRSQLDLTDYLSLSPNTCEVPLINFQLMAITQEESVPSFFDDNSYFRKGLGLIFSLRRCLASEEYVYKFHK